MGKREVQFPFAPWHMWGSSVLHQTTLQAVPPSPFDPQGETRQLARISYNRPDTWSFLFGIVLVQAPDNLAAVNVSIRVDFEILVGIGRSVISLRNGIATNRGFCRLSLDYTTPLVQQQPFATWTTIARTPVLETVGNTEIVQNLTTFPAQDIQCTARIFGTSGAILLGTAYQLEVHSYFAPRTHVRPDWFDDSDQFRGDETGGS